MKFSNIFQHRKNIYIMEYVCVFTNEFVCLKFVLFFNEWTRKFIAEISEKFYIFVCLECINTQKYVILFVFWKYSTAFVLFYGLHSNDSFTSSYDLSKHICTTTFIYSHKNLYTTVSPRLIFNFVSWNLSMKAPMNSQVHIKSAQNICIYM